MQYIDDIQAISDELSFKRYENTSFSEGLLCRHMDQWLYILHMDFKNY